MVVFVGVYKGVNFLSIHMIKRMEVVIKVELDLMCNRGFI